VGRGRERGRERGRVSEEVSGCGNGGERVKEERGRVCMKRENEKPQENE